MPLPPLSAPQQRIFVPAHVAPDTLQFSGLLSQNRSLPIHNAATGQHYHKTFETLNKTYTSLAVDAPFAPDAQRFESFQDEFGAFKLAQKDYTEALENTLAERLNRFDASSDHYAYEAAEGAAGDAETGHYYASLLQDRTDGVAAMRALYLTVGKLNRVLPTEESLATARTLHTGNYNAFLQAYNDGSVKQHLTTRQHDIERQNATLIRFDTAAKTLTDGVEAAERALDDFNQARSYDTSPVIETPQSTPAGELSSHPWNRLFLSMDDDAPDLSNPIRGEDVFFSPTDEKLFEDF